MTPIETPKDLKDVWQGGCHILTIYDPREEGSVTIAANKEGLISLAKLCMFIAEQDNIKGYHIHLDKYSGLDSESNIGVILLKKDFG